MAFSNEWTDHEIDVHIKRIGEHTADEDDGLGDALIEACAETGVARTRDALRKRLQSTGKPPPSSFLKRMPFASPPPQPSRFSGGIPTTIAPAGAGGDEEPAIDPSHFRSLQREQARRARELNSAKSQIRAAENEAAEAEERLELALGFDSAPRHQLPPIKPLSTKRKGRNRAMPVLLCSDWHVEETVDPATVNGRNEYNPEIAAERAAYLFEGAAWKINQWAQGHDITEACVWLGGDMITGYIHEELMECNSMSPTEAVMFAQDLASAGLEYLMKECKLERLYVPCSYGNHGRTQLKPRVSSGAKNSFEWMMYHNLAKTFARDDRFTFDIADGQHLYRDLYGTRVRFHHGDSIGYQGGVGGLSIPLRKKHLAWEKFEHADLTCIGHWHQFVDYGFAMVNGSLIGWAPYAIKIGATYEPPRQGIFLIDEEWGKTDVRPIYCDPRMKAAA